MAKSTVEFWLKDNKNLYLQLPVNPESVRYESPFGINTVNIASLGEVSVPGERGLKSVSFSSFFPRDYNSTYCEYEGFLTPWEWVDQIEVWRDTRKNIRLIIAGTPISIPCYVSEFTLEPEKAGEPGDVYYSLTLVEFRPIKAKQVVAKNTSIKIASERPIAADTKPNSHKVEYYDTLWSLAKRYYGDGTKENVIYDANKSVIGKDSRALKSGMVLKLP